MKTIAVALIVAGVCLAQTASKAAGHWQGKIQIPDRELSITVDIARNPKGAWIGSMSVVGTTSLDVPLNTVTVEEPAVRFAASLPTPAKFEGRLSADGATISGTASSDAGEAPFQLTRSGEANVKVPPPSSALSKEFEGSWEGSVDVGGQARHVRLKLSPAADGAATATLIAVDQGNLELPVASVTIKGKDLELQAPAISGSYRGTLGAGGEIAGEWTQGPNHLPLTFKRTK